MSLASPIPNYDVFAQMQNELKGQDAIELIRLVLEQLMLSHLPKRARLLDLGCGTAQLVQELHIRGYQMTGLDASEDLLHYAKKNALESEFILSDIRKFEFPPTFHGVFSRDTLVYILNLEELTVVFRNVYAALRDNGLFLFTIPSADWHPEVFSENSVSGAVKEVSGVVKDQYAWIRQDNHTYNSEERISESKVTIFELLEGGWHRSDTTWLLKSYFLAEIYSALENVGFTEINHYNTKDFGDPDDVGQACFVCRKPSLTQ